MLIRKNTKAFKTILEIITACQGRADREKLIRLYITRAGTSIQDRISVEGIQGDAAVFYEMGYQNVLNNLESSGRQLNVSDEIPGIYFFRSASHKAWDETPFEFDDAIKKEFSSLPELPVTRKKGKPEKFIFPSGKSTVELRGKKERARSKSVTPVNPEKSARPKKVTAANPEKDDRQPSYKLRHKVQFTDLEKIIFRRPQLNRQDILDYYNKIAEYILPYLKDRPLWVRLQSDKGKAPVELSKELFVEDDTNPFPDWIQSTMVSNGKEKRKVFLCNDREHLLYYVERGCLEFSCGHSRTKAIDSPDYMVLAFDLTDTESTNADAVEAVRVILEGLQLPSSLKINGESGFHLYIPLDSKSTFETSRKVGEYLCKLIALKIPDRVSLMGSDYVYGRVSLDSSLNNKTGSVVAPYSLIVGEVAAIANPLSWDEVAGTAHQEPFDSEKILKRLKKGDVLKALFQKKVNADSLLDRLEENYAFLF